MHTPKSRAERIHANHTAIAKQLRIARQHGQAKALEQESNRLKKHHAMDCGNPECGLCSVRHNPNLKASERLTVQERSSLEVYKDDMRHVGESED